MFHETFTMGLFDERLKNCYEWLQRELEPEFPDGSHSRSLGTRDADILDFGE